MVYAIAALVFFAVAVLAFAGLATVFSEERQVTRRLRDMSEYEAGQAREVEPLLRPFSERVVRPMGGWVRGAGRAMAPAPYLRNARTRLVIAGSPRGMDAERFVAIKVIGAIAVVSFFIAVSLVVPLSALTWLLVAGPLIALAFFGPDLWLSRRTKKRKTAIRRALPDMLDMLTISVEAGLGFDQAIAKLVRYTSGPLSYEFARMLKEIQAGVERSDALRGVAQRTDVSELSGFIMAIVQAEVFGVSVANVLRTQASEMRLKRRQFAEEQAQKAPVKVVFPLIFCILPATLIVILGPAVTSIASLFAG